ncbi:MAG: pyrroline-5-carboxylate reductase [Dorea sp.]|nr:pyrroline-5-carboxylate reductase [Dorea sp.]
MKLGIIGCGNMGRAILYGGLESGVLNKEDIYVYDHLEAARKKIEGFGVHMLNSCKEICEVSDIILLAVKPQQFLETAKEMKTAADGKAIFSIMAGKTMASIRGAISGDVRVLRIMPNTPAMVFEGASGLASDNDLLPEEKDFAQQLFSAIGIVEWVPERLMDAVCGLSGSGPAFTAIFIEALADGGVKNGLPREEAYRLATQTVLGTAKFIMEKGIHPGDVKDMVTSPGGTAIEGCERLEKNGMRYAVIDCVNAATEKSKRL